MKKSLIIMMISAFVVSCSSDDSPPVVEPGISAGDYLPLANNNFWVYEVQNDLQGSRDSIFISGDVQVNGNTYKKFASEDIPLGFYSGTINNNGVRKDGDRLMMTGAAMISFFQDLPLSIDLEDFIIMQENAAAGTTLSTNSSVIPYQFQEYTFNFNYTLSSISQGSLATYTVPGGETYTDVKKVQIKLNVLVNTLIDVGGFSVPVTIMPAQDVVVSTRYYAKDIGVVHSESDIQYELSDFSSFGITLPLPESFSTHEEEILVNYQAE